MKNTRKSQAIDSKEMAVELSNFSFELDEMGEKNFFILSYDWTNEKNEKSGSKEKIFGLIKKDERFDFILFKAKRESRKNGSLAIFGSKGLLKTLQEEHYITEELV